MAKKKLKKKKRVLKFPTIKLKRWEKFDKFIDGAMDICAEPIEAVDEFHEIWEDGMKTLGRLLVNCGAAIINWLDMTLAVMDRSAFIVKYNTVKIGHGFLQKIVANRRMITNYLIGLLLIFIGLLAILNTATGYEYAYKGRTLGVVKNQENVLKIVDVVSKNLSKEYGTNINIDAEEDISFTRVFSLNREIDNMDRVLSRISNMTDTQAEAYAIRIDGKNKYFLESKANAEKVLQRIKNYYIPASKQSKYEYVGFIEDVKVVRVDTIVGNIHTPNSVYKTILKGKRGEAYYKVKSGDTVLGICDKLNISLDSIKKMNPKLDVTMIHAGQKILVSRAVPSLTVKTIGIEKYNKKIPFKTIYKNSSAVYRGDTQISRAGVYGSKAIKSRVVRKNGKKIKEQVLSSKVVRKPISRVVLKGTKKRPPSVGSGKFAWPVHGARLESYFGYRWGRLHAGIDLSSGTGTPIYAADGGTVEIAGWYYGYGYTVIINHQNGYETLYGHCSALYVSPGEKVYKGKHIAAVGNTGNSYGAHLHFEIWRHGTPVDPLPYL